MRAHISLVIAIALIAIGAALIICACDNSPRAICYSSLHGGHGAYRAAAQQSLGRGDA